MREVCEYKLREHSSRNARHNGQDKMKFMNKQTAIVHIEIQKRRKDEKQEHTYILHIVEGGATGGTTALVYYQLHSSSYTGTEQG
jgi:hypothetical protein